MNTYNLIIVRDDCGSGGWSLHTEDQIADADGNDFELAPLLSGPSEYIEETENQYGRWARPNQADYDAAKAIANDA